MFSETMRGNNMEQSTQKHSQSIVEGRVIYILILIVIVQSIYPITASKSVIAVIVYQTLYAGLLVAGILVTQINQWLTRSLVFSGIMWMIVGSVYAFNQEAVWALVLGYVVIGVFQLAVALVLLRFILTSVKVTRDVLYAAAAVYLLLGAVFVPTYGLIDTITVVQTGQNAFVDSAFTGDVMFIPWQTFIYYSYVTITTLGYGDILPVTMWARSAVALEAMIGVLYTTVIIARLVGIYATDTEVKELQEDTEELR